MEIDTETIATQTRAVFCTAIVLTIKIVFDMFASWMSFSFVSTNSKQGKPSTRFPPEGLVQLTLGVDVLALGRF